LATGTMRSRGRGLFLTRWLPVLGYLAVIFILSSIPNLAVPGTFQYRDKVAHLLEYGGLGWFAARAVRDTWPDTGAWRRAIVVLVAVSAVGACDEKYQQWTPGRESSVFDWAADTTGGALAQVVALVSARREKAA
jgi:VanZ family protein